MRFGPVFFAVAALAAATVFTAPARADVFIAIDKSAQQMTVTVDGITRYVWPVSTGAPGYDTPFGEFKPFRMERDHFSREWDDAPMPHSIFFTQRGHAIHGSYHKSIGRPVSHGCVRLQPRNASVLFSLVKQEGMSNTRIVLTGETPNVGDVPVARRAAPSRRRYTSADSDGFVAVLPEDRWQDHWPRDHVMDGWPFYNRYNKRLYYRLPRYGYETPYPYR